MLCPAVTHGLDASEHGQPGSPERQQSAPVWVRDGTTLDRLPFWKAVAATRNKESPKRMKKRKRHPKNRRHNRRQKRRRGVLHCGTTAKKPCGKRKRGTASKTAGVIERILPGCEKPIRCAGIGNKEARFNNRKREEGWLAPAARPLLQTHGNPVRRIRKGLPVPPVVLGVSFPCPSRNKKRFGSFVL